MSKKDKENVDGGILTDTPSTENNVTVRVKMLKRWLNHEDNIVEIGDIVIVSSDVFDVLSKNKIAERMED